MSKARILTIDIETAPNVTYTWGLYNQYMNIEQIIEPGYMLCFAAKWYGEKTVHFRSLYHDGKEVMLSDLWDMMNDADAIMGWNSQSFDIKHINREFVENGYLPPTEAKHIDLLKVVRKNFKFTSNKLDYVSQRLNLGRKFQHSGFQLWKDCMAGDKKAWALMKRYNKQDVRLVEQAYEELKGWINVPTLNVALCGEEDFACPRCGNTELVHEDKPYRTNAHEYEQYRCTSCGYVARNPSPTTKGRRVLR